MEKHLVSEVLRRKYLFKLDVSLKIKVSQVSDFYALKMLQNSNEIK